MFCLHSRVDPTVHSQQGPEREGDLPQWVNGGDGGWGRGNVGTSGWMEWRTGHITPTLDDHVSVTVITVIITAYMMKWQKVLTRLSSSLCESFCKWDDIARFNPYRGLVGRAVQIILL